MSEGLVRPLVLFLSCICVWECPMYWPYYKTVFVKLHFYFKGIFHPKVKILILVIHPMLFQTQRLSFICGTQKGEFWRIFMQLFVIQDSSFVVTMAGKVISLEGCIISEKRNWISVCSSHKAIWRLLCFMVVYCPFSTLTMVNMNCPCTKSCMKILRHSQSFPYKDSSKWLELCTCSISKLYGLLQ